MEFSDRNFTEQQLSAYSMAVEEEDTKISDEEQRMDSQAQELSAASHAATSTKPVTVPELKQKSRDWNAEFQAILSSTDTTAEDRAFAIQKLSLEFEQFAVEIGKIIICEGTRSSQYIL